MRKIICLFASAIAVFASAFAGRIVDEAFMSNYVNRVVAESVTKLVNIAEENANDWEVASNGKLEKEFVIIGSDGLPERTKVQYDVSCEETRIDKLGCVVKSSTHPSFKEGDLLACVQYEGDDYGYYFVNKNIIILPNDDYGYAQMLFAIETDYDELAEEWRNYYALYDSAFDTDYYFKRSTDEIEVTYYDDTNQEIGVVVFAPRRITDAEFTAIVPNDDNNFETAKHNEWAEIAHPQTINFTLTFKEINPALNNGSGTVAAPRISLAAANRKEDANKSVSVFSIPLGADDDPPPDDPIPDDPPPDDPPPMPQGTTKVNVPVHQVCNAPMVYLDNDTACDNEAHEGCYWKPNPNYLEVDWNNPANWITLPISGSIEYHDANGNLVGTAPISIESWAELIRILDGQGLPLPTIPPYAYTPSVVVHSNADNCKNGKHNWVNCKCKKCGAIRQHDFVCKDDDHCATCVNMNTDSRGNETEECGLQCPYSQEQYHRGWHHEQFDEREIYCCSCQCGYFSVGKSLKSHDYIRTESEPEWVDNDYHEIEEQCSRCLHIHRNKEQHTYDSKDSESRPLLYEDGTMDGRYHITTGYCTVCDKNKTHKGNEMFVEHTIRIVDKLCECIYCYDKEGYDAESLHDIDQRYFDACYIYGCTHFDILTGETCQRAVLNAVTGLEPPAKLKIHWPCQEDSTDDKQHFCLCHYTKYDHEYDYSYDGYKFCAGSNSDKYDLDYGWFDFGYANRYCGHAIAKGGHSGKRKCKWNPDHDSDIDDDGNRNKNDPRKLDGGLPSHGDDTDNPNPPSDPDVGQDNPNNPDDPNDPTQRDRPKRCVCGSIGDKTVVVSRSQEFKVFATRPLTGFLGIPFAILPRLQLVGWEHKDVLDTWGERSSAPYRWIHTYYTGCRIRFWPSWMGLGVEGNVDANEQWVQDWINGK